MLTSAIGNKLPRDAGVSLIEALMALMIVSMMAGAVVLLAGGRAEPARAEAERLAARLMLAQEESVIVNRTLALNVTEEGYGFERFEDGRWVAAEHGSPLAFCPWPRELTAELEGDAEGRIAQFDALGEAEAANVVLSQNGARWRVSISAEGEVDVARAE